MTNSQPGAAKAALNILSIFILVIIFGGLIYLTNAAYSQKINETRALLEQQSSSGITTIGPINVDHSVCHYLMPNNSLDKVLGTVLCPGCGLQASWINSNFKVILIGASCARNGTNTMQFIHLVHPTN
jgi:hypothetical protein